MSNPALDIAIATRALRVRVRWKPGKDVRRLEKRKRCGHLPPEFSLAQYNRLIATILLSDESLVYLYQVAGVRYGAVRSTYEGREWLVIFGLDGVMETAFPPRKIEQYIKRHNFLLRGEIGEVLK